MSGSLEALKACPLLKGFTDTGLQILASVAQDRSYPTGTPLFVENMVGDSLVIIGSGHVKLTAKRPSGEEVHVGDLGPGGYLGELSLIQQGQRLCTATATAPVFAVEIRHSDFQKLLAQKPQACVKLLMGICSSFGEKLSDNRDLFKSLL